MWAAVNDPRARKNAQAIPAEMVERCLEIINPADRDHCRVLLNQEFCWLMETHLNPATKRRLRSAAIARDLIKMADAMEVVMQYMQQPPHDHCLLPEGDFVTGLTSLTELWDKLRGAEQEWNRVIDYLRKKANVARWLASLHPKKRGGPRDDFKFNCALAAYRQLVNHGLRPTLSGDGTFFELSQLFYEAVTGKAHANLERQCRDVWHQWAAH
jgi:hypothetical protein